MSNTVSTLLLFVLAGVIVVGAAAMLLQSPDQTIRVSYTDFQKSLW